MKIFKVVGSMVLGAIMVSSGLSTNFDNKVHTIKPISAKIMGSELTIETHTIDIAEVKRERELKELESRRKSGSLLTQSSGIYYFGSQRETYYNLDMSGVVSIMRNLGYSEEEYPYWVREDGVKMFGDYVMIAADLGIHPRGSLVETSLGMAIVCDTGGFTAQYPYGVDIAVVW